MRRQKGIFWGNSERHPAPPWRSCDTGIETSHAPTPPAAVDYVQTAMLIGGPPVTPASPAARQTAFADKRTRSGDLARLL